MADVKSDIAEAALAGLQPLGVRAAPAAKLGAAAGKATSTADEAAAARWPPAEDVVQFFSGRHPRLRQPAEMLEPLALKPRAFVALITFLQGCMQHAAQQPAAGVSVDLLAGLAEHALVRDGTSELARTALAALLGVVPDHMQRIVDR